MPRVGYTQEYKTADATEFPQLKLTNGEHSRIWMPEPPWMEWTHRIEAPVIEDGVPVKEVKEGKNGAYEVTKMDWIGSPFCLGITGSPDNPGPLMDKGIDPDNCPACESAANNTGIQPPQQRFATNVIKYKVRPGTYDLITPVSAEILVWAYTARIYATLLQIQNEYGDLRKLDVKLELEDTKGAASYQRMKQIGVVVTNGQAVPAYSDPKVKAYLQELWVGHPEYRATDEQLRTACKGRDVPRNVIMDMVRRAENQWRQAQQAGTGDSGTTVAAANAAFNGGSLAEGLDSLIASGPPEPGPFDTPASPSAASPAPTTAAAPASPSAPPSADPLAETGLAADPAPDARAQAVTQAADDLFGSPAVNGSAPAESASVLTPAAPAAAGTGDVIDFDDLFKD